MTSQQSSNFPSSKQPFRSDQGNNVLTKWTYERNLSHENNLNIVSHDIRHQLKLTLSREGIESVNPILVESNTFVSDSSTRVRHCGFSQLEKMNRIEQLKEALGSSRVEE
jgi:hypothetical protein